MKIEWSDVKPFAFGACWLIAVVLVLIVLVAASQRFQPRPPNQYTVDILTEGMTITIKCSGDCDLAAMIAEAREAAEK